MENALGKLFAEANKIIYQHYRQLYLQKFCTRNNFDKMPLQWHPGVAHTFKWLSALVHSLQILSQNNVFG